MALKQVPSLNRTPGRPSRRDALRLGATALASLAGVAQAADTPSSAAAPAELLSALPGAQALGSARMRFFGLDIYEARLWVGSGFNPAAYASSPFALELSYARSLSGRLIAERSLKEMRRQGSFSAQQEQAWLEAMVQAFPDVRQGDRITGLHTPASGARFWFNGQERTPVRDADFSRFFFGIWLSQASSEPQMRAQLLGQKTP